MTFLNKYFNKSNMAKFILILLFQLLIIPASAYGITNTNIVFDHLTTKDGLPNNSVNAIVQDNKGYMWFGTDDGLCKYDGYNFKIYKHNQTDKTSISSNKIICIYKDKDGVLWLGTANGINKYDAIEDSFTSYQNNPKDDKTLCSNYVSKIVEDKNGDLWIGTDQGLSRFNKKKKTFTNFRSNVTVTNCLSDNNIYDLCFDRLGNLWIATNNGLNRFNIDKKEFKVYKNNKTDSESISDNSISSIIEDHEGYLWIGTYTAGLNRYDPKKDRFQRFKNNPKDPSSLSTDMILNIYEDSENNIWVSTDNDGGLNLYDRKTGSFNIYKHNDYDLSSISGNCVYAIYEDSSGYLWLGNYKGGLNIYKRGKFINYINDPLNKKSLSNNIVHGIYEDSKGKIWVGTEKGLNSLDKSTGSFKRYFNTTNNSISSNIVESIAEDHYGYLWFGTYLGGINRFDRKTQEFKCYTQNENPQGLNDNIVNTILDDRSGTLWVGTELGGLNKYDRNKDSFIHYVHNDKDPNSISSNTIEKIYQDKAGDIWIGTWDKGICRLDKKSGRFYNYSNNPLDINSLSDNCVSDILEDSRGNLWIATRNGGLNCFDRKNDKFTIYNTKNGLPSNSINNILEDGEENFWLSTYKGLSRFNPKTKVFTNFDTSDGLVNDEFNASSAYKTKTGEMFFGTARGMISFFPDKIKANSKIPKIEITSFKIFDKPINFMKELSQHPYINLSYKDDYFSFEFAALDYKNPGNSQYAYMLEGFDKDWINSGSRRYVSYTNLEGGTYTFKVKAANSNGVWNETGTSIKIRISSPPWKRWWAYTLYVVLGICSIFGFIRLKVRVQEIKLKELANWNSTLEEKVVERTEQLESANEELVAMNDEIYNSNINLSNALKELKETQLQLIQSEKLAALAQMVAGVAHEINTPIGVAITSASFLEDNTDKFNKLYESKQMTRESLEKYLSLSKESIKIILINLTRSGNLVKSFKQLAVDQSSENAREFIVKEYMEQIILSIKPRLKKTKHKINLVCDDNLKINSYPGAISQVITNLIMNSLIHAFEENDEGNINIEITGKAGNLLIRYSDDGKGISEENLNKIFEPFFTTKRGSGGTGLGLNIVYNIITQKLHGFIKCTSEVGKGTVFEIGIPLEKEQ